VDLVRRQFTDLDDLLDLGDAHPSGLGAQRIEVARGLVEHQVAGLVRHRALDQCHVSGQRTLHDVPLVIELAGFLALGDQRAVAGAGEERRDAGAAGAQLLGQGALGGELQLQLAGQVLALELLVAADVGRNHLLDLPAEQQRTKTEVVHPAVVADDGEATLAGFAQRLDQRLGNTTQAEAAGGDGDVVVNDAGQGGMGVWVDLVHEVPLR